MDDDRAKRGEGAGADSKAPGHVQSFRREKINADAIRRILARIAVRGEDDGEMFTDTSRVDAIAKCLGESPWRLCHDGDLAKLYAHRDLDPDKPVVVVSSHVDMVARRCYADCEGEVWKGSFDNLITNAVIVACMLENAFGANVMVAFTGDEECELGGADEVAETLRRNGVPVKYVVVTDVTSEGWHDGKAFTIENIFQGNNPGKRKRTASRLREAVATLDGNPCIGPDEWQDEAWEYDEYGLPCCSVCIPCGGEDMDDGAYMHLEEGVEIRRPSVATYAEALTRVVEAALGADF